MNAGLPDNAKDRGRGELPDTDTANIALSQASAILDILTVACSGHDVRRSTPPKVKWTAHVWRCLDRRSRGHEGRHDAAGKAKIAGTRCRCHRGAAIPRIEAAQSNPVASRNHLECPMTTRPSWG